MSTSAVTPAPSQGGGIGGFFRSIGHFFAAIFQGAVTPSAILGGETPLQVGTSIAALLNPKAPAVVSAGMAALGQVTAAIAATGQAVAAKGLNITFDENAIAAILPGIQDVLAVFEGKTVPAPPAPATK